MLAVLRPKRTPYAEPMQAGARRASSMIHRFVQSVLPRSVIGVQATRMSSRDMPSRRLLLGLRGRSRDEARVRLKVCSGPLGHMPRQHKDGMYHGDSVIIPDELITVRRWVAVFRPRRARPLECGSQKSLELARGVCRSRMTVLGRAQASKGVARVISVRTSIFSVRYLQKVRAP